VWTVNAAGNSTSSAFNYIFKKISGDAGLVVKVNSMSLSSSGCGVMIRSSLAPGASFWDIYLAATGGVGRHWQPKAPWWLKIERVGKRIFTYHSQNGVNWTSMSCSYSDSGYPDDLYYGFYTISNNTSALNTAVFSNVGFSRAAPAGSPDISSALSATATVGSPFTYNTSASGNPTSYSASGLPAGLSINASTGVISGTPTTLGQSEVTITATNANGTGTATLILNVINSDAPPVPASLAASVVNTTQIKLTWSASANATSYSVKRSLSSGGPYTTIQTGITTPNFTDATPTPEVNNYYIVTALTGDKESGISNEVFANVPPAIPSKPVVLNKNNQLDLSWDAASGAVTYKVKRSLSTGGPYTVIAQVSTTNYSDVNVANGTGYYYVISSMGNTLESGNSLESFGVPGSNSSTWSATPVTTNWNNASNWVEETIPTNPSILTFKNTSDSLLTNDLTGLQISRMLFDTSASSYTINGNSFELKTDLVNSSSYTQTINNPITINNQVNISAVSTINLTNAVSGTGSLVKNGGGTLHMSGNNTYSGNTILNGTVAIASIGTGTSGLPTSGPLGNGKIILNGGTLHSGDSTGTIYNDIEVTAGKRSYLIQSVNTMNIYGRITGSGELWEDGNDYPGINLYGDNSGFSGTFIAALRSGRNRVRFLVPESGSANAYWNLDANGIDCIGVGFKTGTLHFGALTGRGYIRNDGGGTPTISIGALNQSTWFGGTLANYFDVVKIGTGTLSFSGNHTYGGTTTIKNGTFLLINSPTNGAFASSVIDSSGTFGGTGLSQASATIGTGTATKAYLAPGDGGIGTLAIAGLTMNSNATYNVEVSTKNATADKMKVSSVSLVGNPALSITDIDSGVLTLGTNFTIIDNTGSNAVSGTFQNLPELGLVKIGNYNFRITYVGGDGNDVVLKDERAMPMTVVSAKADTALVGKSYSYTIQAIHSPTSFNATGLPTGLNVNASTGVISGTPTVTGNFAVVLTAANDTASVTDTLRLAVLNTVVQNVLVAEGDTKVILEWNPILNLTYNIKRSTLQAGPFSLVGNTTTARFTDSLLTNGTTYYYVISSIDGSVEYQGTSPITATPKLGQWDYWKFNDSVGTKAIDSWGARHGILTGVATWTGGVQGKAVQLNGGNGYVSLPSGLLSSLNDFTISSWVRIDGSAQWARLFDFGTGTSNYMFLSPLSGSNTIRYAIKVNGSSEQQLNYSTPLAVGEWHHVAVILLGTVGTLYIDGVAVNTNSNMTYKPSSLGITTQNYIGKSQFSDPYLNGAVDEFRIYNRALSASEIKTVYAQYAPPLAPTNLVVTSSNGQPLLNWSASTSAASYNVKRATNLTGPYTTIATVSSTSFADTSAASCGIYFYVVSANSSNSNLESVNSSVGTLLAGKKLSGTVIGTAGAWNNGSNTKEKAVDGSITTYFDGPTANGVWVGYDLGADSTQAVFKIRYVPRATFASRMVGGVFQGSNAADFSTAKTLYTIKTAPPDGVYTTQIITTTAPYRYVRYLSPNNGYGNVAEIEFYGMPGSAPQITSKAGMQNVSYGATFNYAIQASNTPNNYSATGLPHGLSLNTCTGVISGALNAAGTFPVILTASNTFGSAKDSMMLIIKKDQFITFNVLQQKKIGDADFDAGAIASSDLAVKYSSSDTTVAKIVNGLVEIVGRGTTNITAFQSGDSIYKAAAAVTQQLVVYQLPTVKTKDIQIAVDANGNASITSHQVDDGSVSYSGALTLSLDRTQFTCPDISSPVTVTLTATDADGHSSSATAEVTVVDNIKPSITAPVDIKVNADKGNCSASNVSLGTPITNDNCGVQSIRNDAPVSFPVGTTNFTWTVTDIHGNTSTAQQTVTVVDDQKPTVASPADQFFCYNQSGSYSVPSLTASDNCGVASINYIISGATSRSSNGPDASGAFNVGQSTITWTVIDIHGNVNTATITVTVNAPVSANIRDVYAMNPAVDAKNTIYIGYGPTALTISVNASGGTTPYTYQWNNGATSQSISVSAAGIYSVTVTDSKGCSTTADIVMNVLDVRCGNNNDKVMICHNNNAICVASAAVQDHLNHGDHLGGCGAYTTSRDGNQPSDMQVVNSVVVYPIPAHENINIKLSRLQQWAMFIVYDATGKIVLSDRMTNNTKTISVKSLAAGVYYVQIRNGKSVTTQKIVKE
jgi:autotransporter-associated beta strand protein